MKATIGPQSTEALFFRTGSGRSNARSRFVRVYSRTHRRVDGWASLELSTLFTYDAKATVSEVATH
jgi:hypothetical protein